jgi:hypothetical protein
MKEARKRVLTTKQSKDEGTRRPVRGRYRLDELLAQMPPGPLEWTPEMRAWDEMKPVGREFGAEPAGR